MESKPNKQPKVSEPAFKIEEGSSPLVIEDGSAPVPKAVVKPKNKVELNGMIIEDY